MSGPTAPTVRLDEPAARDAALVGEKAAGLARLKQAGLPVPDGFVIHARAHADALSSIADELSSILGGDAPVDARGRAAQTLIAGLAPGAALRDAVHAAHAHLGHAGPLVVRSSGTLEDLAGASFAGQYDSFVNVVGPEAVLSRMLEVWASLHSAHAIAYRERMGIGHAGARMAVLVQRLSPSRASGVLFTRDPMRPDASRMVVNATLGLGEGVVAGDMSSDVFALDAATLEVVERQVSDKAERLAPADGAGMAREAVPDRERRAPALADDELAALGGLAQRVRELEGGERDIEFCIDDAGLWLLQARPVTGLDRGDDDAADFEVSWDDPADRAKCWRLWGDDHELKPMYRLQQDLREVYAENRRRMVEETGSLPPLRECLVRVFHGYAYLSKLDIPAQELDARLAKMQALGDALAAERRDYYAETIEPELLSTLAELGPFERPAGESLASRFAFLERALAAYGRVMGDLHWRQLTTRGMPGSRPGLPEVFHELTGEPPQEVAVFLQGVDHRTAALVRRLRQVARHVQDDATLAEVFGARDFGRLEAPELTGQPAAAALRDEVAGLLRDFGRRTGMSYGSAAGFDTPTWNLEPERALELVATYAERDLDDLDAREAEARREREGRVEALRERLSDEDFQRFDHALWLAEAQVRQLENHNALMEQGVAGVWREAMWWMGEALTRDGLLDTPDDAMHLSMQELSEVAAGEARDLRARVAERRAERTARAALTPPKFLGEGERPDPNAPEPGAPKRPDAGLSNGVLVGTPASRGRATGRARVVAAGRPPPKFEQGDILVARNVGQDFTPIFPLLGGIVLDAGAIFQHAALIAREYRIPAVLQTQEGTSVIADGQPITVDGSRGTVELTPSEAPG